MATLDALSGRREARPEFAATFPVDDVVPSGDRASLMSARQAKGDGMSGSLFHAPSFEQVWYTAADGHQHYELVPRGGDTEGISISSWREVEDYFESVGVPRHVWPVYEGGIDAPLPEIEERNEVLRRHLGSVTLSAPCPGWAELVFRLVRAGELLFYSTE